MIALGKTFLKSLRKSQTIQEVDEDQAKERCFHDEPRAEEVMFSRDSLEPEGWSFTRNCCSFWHIGSIAHFCINQKYFLFGADSLAIYGSAQSAAVLSLRTLNEEVEQASFLAKESVTEESRLNKDQESFSPALASSQRCYKDSGGKSVTMY